MKNVSSLQVGDQIFLLGELRTVQDILAGDGTRTVWFHGSVFSQHLRLEDTFGIKRFVHVDAMSGETRLPYSRRARDLASGDTVLLNGQPTPIREVYLSGERVMFTTPEQTLVTVQTDDLLEVPPPDKETYLEHDQAVASVQVYNTFDGDERERLTLDLNTPATSLVSLSTRARDLEAGMGLIIQEGLCAVVLESTQLSPCEVALILEVHTDPPSQFDASFHPDAHVELTHDPTLPHPARQPQEKW